VLDSLNINIAIGNECPLTVKFRVELSILPLTVVIDRPLFIDFGSESLDEADVGIDA
jgi:hypothetical protein